jgi:hypothetical protein
LNAGDASYFFPCQFKNGTAELTGNPAVGFGPGQSFGEKGVIQTFPAGGKALNA